MSLSSKTEIRRFIVDNFLFGEGDDTLADADSLMEKGIVDSTGVLQIVAFLDEHYGVAVADNELVTDNFDSIDKLSAFLASKRPA